MRNFIGIKQLMVLICLAALLLAIGGCSKKIVGEEKTTEINISINARIDLSGATASAAASYGVLVVTAKDLQLPLIDTMNYINGAIVGEITVMTGDARQFDLKVYDASGILTYRGVSVIDIPDDETIELFIQLIPVKPMMNITPHYQTVAMGEDFLLNINLLNFIDTVGVAYKLYGISFNFLYSDATAPLFPNYTMGYVMRGSTLPPNAIINNEGGTGQEWIGTGWTDQVNNVLTDSLGNVQLAKVRFSTYGDWSGDTATAHFSIRIDYIYLNTGGDAIDTLPVKNVYTDDAEVFIYRGVSDY